MMKPAPTVNKSHDPTVGTRLPPDEVALLDAVKERAGDPDRATTIRRAIRAEIERCFPGAIQEAA